MPNHEQIYLNEAQQYEMLISREDYEGNILRTLQNLMFFDGLDVIDLGAGSGRLSCLLAPYAKSIIAIDESGAMLEVAAHKLEARGYTNWRTVVSEHRKLHIPDRSADVVVAGWTLCYLASSNVDLWQEKLQEAMDEIKRVLRPGGTVLILETLGTGHVQPTPPDFLVPYYESLQQRYGFSHQWIRTDFQFESVQEAERLTGFFFGSEFADQVNRESWDIVPECTGIWYKHNFREDTDDSRGGSKG